nr:hypothetical protein [Tanacetum cinerariifolium]
MELDLNLLNFGNVLNFELDMYVVVYLEPPLLLTQFPPQRDWDECDMMLHMEKSDMLMLDAEIDVGDKTADDVDKLACAADVVKPRQVDLKFAHASI